MTRMFMTATQIAAAAYAASFRGSAVGYMTAIALAESDGNTDAISPVVADGTRGYGLCQIETENIHGGAWWDAGWQMTRAFEMSGGGTNFEPWCTACRPMPIWFDGRQMETGCANAGSGAAEDHLAVGMAAWAIIEPRATAWPGTLLRLETPPIYHHGTGEWQNRLNLVDDAGLKVDDSFGPATAAATVAFQKTHGLGADGVVGPKTWAAGFALQPMPAAKRRAINAARARAAAEKAARK